MRLRAGEMPPPSSELPPVPVAVIDAIAELIDSVVPGVGNDRCHFKYLGDSVRCENADEAGTYRLQGEAALEDCFEACLAQPDCASVTDYSWLGRPDLGCDLYTSTCDAPSSGDWQEQDAGDHFDEAHQSAETSRQRTGSPRVTL